MFIFLGDFGCRKSIPTPPPISQPKIDNMRYRVIKRFDFDELKEYVNLAIEDGWVPQGGICVTVNLTSTVYYQAMIKNN
jgi:hypothetical protein